MKWRSGRRSILDSRVPTIRQDRSGQRQSAGETTVKIRRSVNSVCIDLGPAEARVFLEELSDVRGGARRPKIRQLCKELETALSLGSVTPASRKKEGKNDGRIT